MKLGQEKQKKGGRWRKTDGRTETDTLPLPTIDVRKWGGCECEGVRVDIASNKKETTQNTNTKKKQEKITNKQSLSRKKEMWKDDIKNFMFRERPPRCEGHWTVVARNPATGPEPGRARSRHQSPSSGWQRSKVCHQTG